MKSVSYILFRSFIGFVYLLPFKVLYWFSDGIALILSKVLSYRRKVIQNNLKNSFPNLNSYEIQKLTKSFYTHLSDTILESIKFYSSPIEAIYPVRYKFEHTEILNEMIKKHDGVMVLISHYNNWEWGVPLLKKSLEHNCLGFYSPLHHTLIDRYVYKKRSQFGTKIYPSNKALRVINQEQDNKPIYFMVADQSPSNLNKVEWINFLNQQTAFLNGPEKIAIRYNYPALYLHVTKEKRGCYKASFEMLMEDTSEMVNGGLTKKYAAHLEKKIIENPKPWLWSHRRWKHKPLS